MSGNQQPSIDASEHLGAANGENIEAKRVAQYVWDNALGQWKRHVAPLIDGSFDYVGFTNVDGNGNYQTVTFKSGGSGGSTVRTLALTYDGNNNVTSIART